MLWKTISIRRALRVLRPTVVMSMTPPRERASVMRGSWVVFFTTSTTQRVSLYSTSPPALRATTPRRGEDKRFKVLPACGEVAQGAGGDARCKSSPLAGRWREATEGTSGFGITLNKVILKYFRYARDARTLYRD